MADTSDIRSWLREERPDLHVGLRGRLSPQARAAYDEGHQDEREVVSPHAGDVEFSDLVDQDSVETRPLPPEKAKTGWRFWDAPPKEKVSSPRKRTSTSKLVSLMWSGGANLLRNPQVLPVARCLEMQAPVAGEVFDDMVKGTIVDKILQPVARAGDKGEDFFALVGPPALTFAVCAQPELYPVVRPLMIEAMKSWVVIARPKLKAAKVKEEKLIRELGEDYGPAIEDMLDAIFAPIPTTAPADEYASV